MKRTAILALLLCTGLSSSRAAGPASPEPVPLQRDAAKALIDWLDRVASNLTGALRSETPPQAELLALARDRGQLIGDVVTIRQTLPQKKRARPEAHFTGVTVVATAWFGIVPVARAELMLWVGKGELRLLRLRPGTVERRAFVVRRGPERTDAAGKALTALVQQIMGEAAAGRCDRLPVLTVADVRAASPDHNLPPEGTRALIARFAAEARATCESLRGTPFQRASLDAPELTGAITAGREPARPFSLSLATTAEGELRLGVLTMQ
ncbi:MAG: hypothetical protein H6744_03465 [Deltaproteobacteria bacterium]|nr:hypothetical protein [Deltaproteobacteria bacterium]MCB9785735.1 hypothetical protein [Deltaproteobacteria bacterium]